METSQLDVIAVGAHPDDVEIACGGTLAMLARQGYRVGIVDLTDGEPTPLCDSPAVRLAEARRAAETLGVADRVTLDLPNRRLFDTFEARVALAKEFRRRKPRLVLGLGGKTPLASPDHYQASLIIEAAVFYSKLTKWDQYFDGLPPYPAPPIVVLRPVVPNGFGRRRRGDGRGHRRDAGDEARGHRLLHQPVSGGQVRRRRALFEPMPSSRAWRPASPPGN